MPDPQDATLQIVAFTIDDVGYAFRIDAVKEIIRYVKPQPTSTTVPWMQGVINLRGSIVPVIELGVRLGRVTQPIDPATAKVLVLEDGADVVGTLVTSVDEVRTISSDQLRPAPAGAGSWFVESIVTLDERMLMLLDAAQLLAPEALAA
jgi:purine-binding chemotaxis protein CheW